MWKSSDNHFWAQGLSETLTFVIELQKTYILRLMDYTVFSTPPTRYAHFTREVTFAMISNLHFFAQGLSEMLIFVPNLWILTFEGKSPAQDFLKEGLAQMFTFGVKPGILSRKAGPIPGIGFIN